MNNKNKIRRIALTVAAFVMVAVLSIGGTIAWLTDETEAVENTFTKANIDIDLDESDELDLKMVPGKVITKDPVVTVKADSEACWLFVKVEKSENFDNFMTYAMADGWTELKDVEGVYYREVAATTKNTDFDVINENEVTVKTEVTKAMMDALTENTYPTLTFTAYACQKDNVADVATAWAALNVLPADDTAA